MTSHPNSDYVRMGYEADVVLRDGSVAHVRPIRPDDAERIHLLDLARYLAGPVTRVYGLAGHTDRPDFPGLDVPTVSTAARPPRTFASTGRALVGLTSPGGP